MNIHRICDLIEERKQELFELLRKLIAIDSESFGEYGNEEECAKYIHGYCNGLGLESDLFSPLDIDGFTEHPDYVPNRSLENRYNTVAKWKGENDTDEIMLMAHTDTVRIGDIANWHTAPLCSVIKDGKIYGRGACDDKYAIATALFVIKLLKEQGFKPRANLLFAAYSDEEYGGSHGALASVLKYPCNRIINMDGDDNQIWHCASGGGELKYHFHTKNTVDSAKDAALAIPVVLQVLDKFSNARRAELEENEFYKGTIIPQTALRYMGVRAGNDGSDLGTGEAFFVFYTDKTKSEIDKELEALEKELSAALEPLGIIGDGFKPNTRFFHYVYCAPDSEDIKLLVEASKETTGIEPLVCGSCLSDLSVISKYGNKNAIAYGVGRDFSEVGGAHQPDEFIECDKFVQFTKTIAAYIIKVLG